MNLVARETFSHWYQCKDGVVSACHELPKKNGDGMKQVTLREARQLRLWPSVTNVLSVLNKEALNSWRVEQAILAALTLPRLVNEDLGEFAKRVVTDMEAQSTAAKEFGTRIHDAAGLIVGRDITRMDPELSPYLKGLHEWYLAEAWGHLGHEMVVGNGRLGYAGRFDLECELNSYGYSVVDFKTQKVRRKDGVPQPAFYDEWALQLAAYAACLREWGRDTSWPALVSVVIDSSEPGPVHVKVWEDPRGLYNQFLNCFSLWCWQKDYQPMELPQEAA